MRKHWIIFDTEYEISNIEQVKQDLQEICSKHSVPYDIVSLEQGIKVEFNTDIDMLFVKKVLEPKYG